MAKVIGIGKAQDIKRKNGETTTKTEIHFTFKNDKVQGMAVGKVDVWGPHSYAVDSEIKVTSYFKDYVQYFKVAQEI